MKRRTFWALAACVAAAGSISSTSPAESFASYTLTGSTGYNLIGIDGSGNVAIQSQAGCSSTDPNPCFEIFSGGQLVSASDALTNFTPDDGMACAFTSTATEVQIGQSVCNGGNHVVGVQTNGGPAIVFLSYTGADLVTVGTADLLFVNTAGDFVITDGLDGEIREFTPSPEPGTLALVATAALAGAALLYRRRHAQ